MSRSFTATELIDRAKRRVDMSGSNNNFITDSEWLDYLNASNAELRDILYSAYGSYYNYTSSILTMVDGQSLYSLPNDFYRLLEVNVKDDENDWFSAYRFTSAERNVLRSSDDQDWSWPNNVFYRVEGNTKIRFYPLPSGGEEVEIGYQPTTQILSLTGTVDGINGYEELIVTTMAMKAREKEEEDTSLFEKERERLIDRIRTHAMDNESYQGWVGNFFNLYDSSYIFGDF